MSNPSSEPREPRPPAPETPNYVTGSRKEQVVFYVTLAVMTALLLGLIAYALAG